MNLKHVWIVFKKEVKDIARDRKTILTNILVPIVLMPLLFYLLGGGIERMGKDITENITIALSVSSDTEEIRNLLKNDIFAGNPNIKLLEAVEDPEEAVRSERVRFVIDVDKDYAKKLEDGLPFSITVTYDQSNTKSSGSYRIILDSINEYNQKIVKERLKNLNIDINILEPTKVIQKNVAKEKTGGNMMLMMMLPMLVSILMAVGGIPAATDLVAGEKERGTLEPLLTTQSGRVSILLGKYLTVTAFSIVCVISQFIGVAIGFKISPNFLIIGGTGTNNGFNIPPLALLLIVIITITLGMFFSGIQLAISTYARSFKEAQTYLSFLMIIAMVPAYATMMLQPGDVRLYMFFIPLLNVIASLKMVLGNIINYTYLGIAFGTSIIYVVISLIFAASLFNKEKVLFRN
ncbi:MAG TPA: ABC transporter permease [Clostridiaceae bacterium]|nr:ABC transporter permease [Clostridiaceae bacterium]